VSARFTTTGRDSWSGERAKRTDADRLRFHGKLQPLDPPRRGLLARLFGRLR
jgi:hypothetical protein